MKKSSEPRPFTSSSLALGREHLQVSDLEFEQISLLMSDRTGIHLDHSKIPMIQGRLSKRLSALGIESFREYLKYLAKSQEEMSEFIGALTTHKTDFFREPEHFDFFKKTILPMFLTQTHFRTLNVWSAACSSGEEIYTIALVLLEYFGSIANLSNAPCRLLGTDIDDGIIAKAQEGVYRQAELEPVSAELRRMGFYSGRGRFLGHFKVRSEIQQLVKFRNHNLLEEPKEFGNLRFQVIFLRNVLIYFPEETRQLVIDHVCSVLVKGGYLFVGHSESLSGLKHNLQSVSSAVYQKV